MKTWIRTLLLYALVPQIGLSDFYEVEDNFNEMIASEFFAKHFGGVVFSDCENTILLSDSHSDAFIQISWKDASIQVLVGNLINFDLPRDILVAFGGSWCTISLSEEFADACLDYVEFKDRDLSIKATRSMAVVTFARHLLGIADILNNLNVICLPDKRIIEEFARAFQASAVKVENVLLFNTDLCVLLNNRLDIRKFNLVTHLRYREGGKEQVFIEIFRSKNGYHISVKEGMNLHLLANIICQIYLSTKCCASCDDEVRMEGEDKGHLELFDSGRSPCLLIRGAGPNTVEIASHIFRLNHIKEVRIEYLHDWGIEAFAQVFKNCDKKGFSHVRFGNIQNVNPLCEALVGITNIRKICFKRCLDLDVGKIIELLKTGICLKKIVMCEGDLTDDTLLPLIGFLMSSDTLVELDLSSNRISPEGAGYIAQLVRESKTLKMLSLRGTPTTKGLGGNCIEDRGMQALIKSLMSPGCSLEKLNISYDRSISEKMVKYVESLKANRKIGAEVIFRATSGNPLEVESKKPRLIDK